ncbi:threonyl-tRNA synthetase, putative [Babesia ovis]|uniref:Threonyl-tRNA synthetase, putative n=1 Tax=Babesia ovis TaxID=5869 RepID=A0A9W5TDS6_BABOV|nr:threonyl-tRNA synthetase, putative [Babesia ovis]
MERQNTFSTSRRSGFARLAVLVLGVTLIANLNTGNVVAKGTKNVVDKAVKSTTKDVEKAVKSTTKDVEKAVKQDVKQEVKSTTKDVEKEKKQLGPKEVKSLKGVTFSQSPNTTDTIKVTIGPSFYGSSTVTFPEKDIPKVEKNLKKIINKITHYRPRFEDEKQFQEVVQILKNITSIELPCDVAKEILECDYNKMICIGPHCAQNKVSTTVFYLRKLFKDSGFRPESVALWGVATNPWSDFLNYLDRAIREG